MNKLYLALIAIFIGGTAQAQIIWEDDFSDWSGGNPSNWTGSTGNFQPDSVEQSSNGATFGPYLAELTNFQGPHRRLSSSAISLNEGVSYEVEVWAKGNGDVRVGLWDSDMDNFDFGYSSYTPYETLSGDDVVSFVRTVTPDTTSSIQQIIISTIGGLVEIDKVEVRIGEQPEATPRTIPEIQNTTDPDGDSPELGNLVITSGVVTAVAEGNGDFGYWIQDGTGPWTGIHVFDNTNVPSLGDVVSITGMVGEFFGNTNIGGVTSYEVTGSQAVPAPQMLSTSGANDEQYEGVLVMTSAECTEGWNQFNEWTLNDGSGTILINDAMYEFEPTVGTEYDVTGPLVYAFGSYRIEPRDMDDVSLSIGLVETSAIAFEAFPNPTADFLTITHDLDGQFFVQIIDANGRLVSTSRLTDQVTELDLRSYAAGNYTMVLFNENHATARKILVK